MSKHTTFDQLKMLAQRTKTEIDKVDTKVTTLEERADKMATMEAVNAAISAAITGAIEEVYYGTETAV